MTTATAKRGRPEGAKARHYLRANESPSRCPKEGCGSTERGPLSNRTEHEAIGEDSQGPYNLIVWHTCQCVACGQWRRVRSVEYRVAE